MNTLLLSGLLLLTLLVLAIFWRRGRQPKRLPYALQETLFSPAERSFLGVLDLAVGDQARVLAKVRVADVLTPQAGLSKSKWQQHVAKISDNHFDYLLCRPSDLSIICAIELDDSSHRHQPRKGRDLFVKAACDSAGLPLLQIAASSHYLVEELREQILPLLVKTCEPLADALLPGERREPTFDPLLLDTMEVGAGGGRSAHKAPSAVAARAESAEPLLQARKEAELAPIAADLLDELFTEVAAGEEFEVHHCPRCDAPLVEREAKKGPHAGRLFLACSRFPACRYAAPYHHGHH